MKQGLVGSVLLAFCCFGSTAIDTKADVSFSLWATNLASGTEPRIVPGDLDSDGRFDLLLNLRSSSSSLSWSSFILTNRGDGQFGRISVPSFQSPGLDLADFNSDGKLDLFTVGGGGGGIYYQTNNLQWQLHHRIDGAFNSQCMWAFLDGDARLDAYFQGGTIKRSEMWRQGDEGLFARYRPPEPPFFGSSFLSGDFDNNGRIDFVVLGTTNSEVLFLNKGESGFTRVNPGLPGTDYVYSGVAADFNNDSLMDLILQSGRSATNIFFFANQGRAEFTVQALSFPFRLDGFSACDLNDDGLIDLLVMVDRFDSSGHSGVYLNRSTSGKVEFERIDFDIRYGRGTFADLTGDGHPDLILNSGNTQVFRNEYAGAKSTPPAPLSLNAEFDGRFGARFHWKLPEEFESERWRSLSFNLRLGESPNGIELISPNSDLVTGRRLVDGFGNAWMSREFTVERLKPGRYYWSVQSVDSAWRGSPFSSEKIYDHTTILEIEKIELNRQGQTNGV